jgi:glycosyltransferase involved in cell wall biosynthesis
MRLLIITQKVDSADANLGFFHAWIKEFSKHCQVVTVICLQKGTYSLPENVRVLSLGKDEGKSRLTYLIRFYKYIIQERITYTTVFIHMNPEYAVLGGLLWKILHKNVALWYTHKSVTLKLRIAEKFVSRIFSASKESFRLATPKLMVTGHGIDTEQFKPRDTELPGTLTILSAGRISRSKNIHILIETAAALRDRNTVFLMRIAGEPVTDDDRVYFDEIKLKVAAYKIGEYVQFIGTLQNNEMPDFYHSGHIFINLSDTGSIDKAILEAMASGLHVLTSNEAFASMLDQKYKTEKDSHAIAEKIVELAHQPVDSRLREIVVNEHNLSILIRHIIDLSNAAKTGR